MIFNKSTWFNKWENQFLILRLQHVFYFLRLGILRKISCFNISLFHKINARNSWNFTLIFIKFHNMRQWTMRFSKYTPITHVSIPLRCFCRILRKADKDSSCVQSFEEIHHCMWCRFENSLETVWQKRSISLQQKIIYTFWSMISACLPHRPTRLRPLALCW